MADDFIVPQFLNAQPKAERPRVPAGNQGSLDVVNGWV